MKTTFVDLKDTDLYRDGIPHEVFARLRREASVAWNPEGDGRGFWAVTRYEDIVAASKRPEVFSSYRKHGGHRMFDENVTGVAGVGAEKAEAPMISLDPPEHNQYRRMVSPGFAPRRVLIAEDDPEYRPSPEALAKKIAAMSEYALGLWKERLEHPGDDCLSPLAMRPPGTRSQVAFSR
jgi:cytochrome P450